MKTLEVLDKYLKGKKQAKTTKELTGYVLRKFAEYSPEWPDKPVVVNEFLNSLNLSDTSVRLYFAKLMVVGKYFHTFYDMVNPVEKAEKPSVKKRESAYRTPDEIKRMLAACRLGFDNELVLTFFESTARTSELANLQGKNIGEDSIKIMGKEHEVEYTLNPELCRRLKIMAGNDEGYVFKDKSGKKATRGSIYSRIRRICKRAGINGKGLGGHALRHAAATIIADRTGNIFAVKAKLQHDSIKSSQVYVDKSVEGKLKHNISPLRFLADTPWTGNEEVKAEQLKLTEGISKDLVVTTPTEIAEGIVDMSDDMFPRVNDNIRIRPLLDSDDLDVIREGFILLARNEKYHLKMLKAHELYKRILRKAGK